MKRIAILLSLLSALAGCATQALNGPSVATTTEEGNSCPVDGRLAEAANGASVLACADGKWKDTRKLERATVRMSIADSRRPKGYQNTEFSYLVQVGIPTDTSTKQGEFSGAEAQSRFVPHDGLHIETTVRALNADNTANVRLEISGVDAGQNWDQKVDVTVPVGVTTTVIKDVAGVDYAVNVTKQPS